MYFTLQEFLRKFLVHKVEKTIATDTLMAVKVCQKVNF